MLQKLLPFIIVLPSTVYSLISLKSALSFYNRKSTETSLKPVAAGVTILKPVKGMDAGSYNNFASFCKQKYPGPIQILFAAASADDPVIQVILKLISDFPALDISLEINATLHGPNYKVSNLINIFPKANYDIIIVCDSDIRVSSDYLDSVTSHFSDPRIGLVTSLYRTSNVHNIATAIEATGFTVEMVPNVLVALQFEGLTFALGASMAVRREALASIGGFNTLRDYLADDYQLGNKVHHAGWAIELDNCFVESIMKEENLNTVLSRQLRWARTMRVSRPGGYLASGITLPFPAALLTLIIAPSKTFALAVLGLQYAVRLSVSTIFSRLVVRDNLLPRWICLIPLRDLLSFTCWLLSFLGNRVKWRNKRFKLKPGGKIDELS